MSGGDFRGLIPASNDPMLAFLVSLQKLFIRQQNQNAVSSVSSDNEDIYSTGIDVDTVVRFHSELSGVTKFPFNHDFYPPFEPDGNQVKLWIRGSNTGNKLREISNFGVTVTINGDPTLVDGNIDLGTFTDGTKSIALRMNRPTSITQNREYLEVPDSTNIQVAAVTTGLSIFVRFRMNAIADQDGIAETIIHKIDDSTPSNGYMLQVLSDGRLLFIIRDGGVTTAKYAAAGSIVINTIYDVFLTYTVTGSVLHIYINGVDKTLTTFAGTVNFQDDLINHNLFVGTRGKNVEYRGSAYFDFYDLKYYKDRVVTQTEVTNHQTNKWTISAIAFGQVMITDHYYSH